MECSAPACSKARLHHPWVTQCALPAVFAGCMRDTVSTFCDTTACCEGKLLSSGGPSFGFTDCKRVFLRGYPLLGPRSAQSSFSNTQRVQVIVSYLLLGPKHLLRTYHNRTWTLCDSGFCRSLRPELCPSSLNSMGTSSRGLAP